MERVENEYLESLLELEDLAEKKANIYGRLLLDVDLAKEMESLASRHKARRECLEQLLYGKSKTKKSKANEGGKYEMKEEKTEK